MTSNPLGYIAGPESSYGLNQGSPAGSTASGIWMDVQGTWSHALSGIGLSTAQYPTAQSAPPSVQAAANAYLINTQGLSPWTCTGCDPTVSGLVASGTLAQSGYNLSTNPSDYAFLDTAQAQGTLGSTLQAMAGGSTGQTIGPNNPPNSPFYQAPGTYPDAINPVGGSTAQITNVAAAISGAGLSFIGDVSGWLARGTVIIVAAIAILGGLWLMAGRPVGAADLAAALKKAA